MRFKEIILAGHTLTVKDGVLHINGEPFNKKIITVNTAKDLVSKSELQKEINKKIRELKSSHTDEFKEEIANLVIEKMLNIIKSELKNDLIENKRLGHDIYKRLEPLEKKVYAIIEAFKGKIEEIEIYKKQQ